MMFSFSNRARGLMENMDDGVFDHLQFSDFDSFQSAGTFL